MNIKNESHTSRRWLQRYLGLLKVAEEAELLWPQDQQCMTSTLDAPGSPAHPVDVLLQTQKHFKIQRKCTWKAVKEYYTRKNSVVSAFKVLNFNKIVAKNINRFFQGFSYTLGSSGGSYWTIQSTSGISSPRAATSVHKRMPESALQNWKKVVVRLVCFCFPWVGKKNWFKAAAPAGESMKGRRTLTWMAMTGRSM